ncbi:MAG TPA: D-alanine--D-alanine ligase [Opitutaceae bacterium]|jgi:D-alanine-D-alanine ligase|nr:D-alanine--D-alanine ligase [Opitutaceae bacterium]MBP8961389.1 D-alanine--D-alanine ligase [Opitutaceae bacterium]HOF09305.1 D-alanine--D-alanine ligase [Opitutaceae bacterium]HOR24646.1 D-alanine--D-alanine ligase [Opitutaceae bacterium]HPK48952.1 D-alanine--D-alanine ligase [Opitutaceae bacterium]
MKTTPIIAVFCGGTSAEKEVSLGSGRACALALARNFPTRLFEISENALPAGLDPERHVVFSTLHGTFGEDGGMQSLLDAAGVEYAGCTAEGSAVCFNKQRTKKAVAAAGVNVCAGHQFSTDRMPDAAELVASLGEKLILKPTCNGSSVGLHVIESAAQLGEVLSRLPAGDWLVERRVFGRELTVGVLGGKAMAVVEVAPKSGLYDYTSKYTKGMTEYLAPAPLPDEVTRSVQAMAERAFAAAGCRDYARIDFMLSGKNEPFFLEINTLPGMKDTSLLPMSARCVGLDFTALVRELVAPALARFSAAHK